MLKLNRKEELFCFFYSELRDARAAAALAGFSLTPRHSGTKLLAREEIRAEIAKICKNQKVTSSEVSQGFRRLAFGSVADAFALLLREDYPDAAELEKMELFNVAEIKRPKSGGLEIKFFDRLKALDKLRESEQSASGGSAPDFFRALENSARALNGGRGNE